MASIEAPIISTADPAELDKFADLGGAWWATNGPMAPLHKFNPVRLAFIRDQACRHFRLDTAAAKPLRHLRVLDVGCGGGLLAEPLARLGGHVTAIDPLHGRTPKQRESRSTTGPSRSKPWRAAHST